jgi:hypothetical protein
VDQTGAVVRIEKPCDDGRRDRLRRAAGAVVTLDGNAQPLRRQRGTIGPLGACLHEHALAEPAHDVGNELAGAGDVPGLRRTRGPQTLRCRRTNRSEATSRRKDREGARQRRQWHRKGWHRAAVDANAVIAN